MLTYYTNSNRIQACSSECHLPPESCSSDYFTETPIPNLPHGSSAHRSIHMTRDTPTHPPTHTTDTRITRNPSTKKTRGRRYTLPRPQPTLRLRHIPTVHPTHVFYFLCSNVDTPQDTTLFTISQPVYRNGAHDVRSTHAKIQLFEEGPTKH